MACNEIMSNNNNNNMVNDDHYDALSFCDLPIHDNTTELEPYLESSSSDNNDDEEEFFEFLPSPEEDETPNNNKAIIFCGKPIASEKQPPNNKDSLFSRLPRNGLFIRKDHSSFKKSHSSKSDPMITSPKSGSSSFRFGGPKAGPGPAPAPPPASGSYYRSSSGGGSWRKQMVMIGLVKLEPKMELSDIRKRQRRRNPVPLFPATASADDGNGKAGSDHHNWGLLGPLRCRVHLVTAFTKASFGCISHA